MMGDHASFWKIEDLHSDEGKAAGIPFNGWPPGQYTLFFGPLVRSVSASHPRFLRVTLSRHRHEMNILVCMMRECDRDAPNPRPQRKGPHERQG